MITGKTSDDSSSKPTVSALATRECSVGERLNSLKRTAAAMLHEIDLLNHETVLTQISSTIDNLETNGSANFFEEVRRFEMELIGRALDLTGGNQARAARLLGLSATTLNYKIKTYKML